MPIARHSPCRLAWCLLPACFTAALALPLRSDEPPPPAAPAGQAETPLNAAALATRIDDLLAARWSAEQIEPAPLADDAEFLRRVSLDIAGRIPSVSEAREFLASDAPAKRAAAVERLLSSAGYAAHLARALRDVMLPGASANPQTQLIVLPFESWLRLRLSDDVPYDQLVGELLTAGTAPDGGDARRAAAPSPAAFFQVNEYKPENLAASTSRIFLGVQVQCAQCHNHPFARWTREEFWRFAGFFTPDSNDRRGLEIPNTGNRAAPRFLDGSDPGWAGGESGRVVLARWLASRDNPYFARATVNRLWYQFFGHGLVEPADDLDESNPPSHPEILDELTRQFVAHGFDLKFLVRTITATRAYQLSSRTTHPSQDDPRSFARMPLRSMTADQLYDSLVQATGFEEQPATGWRAAAMFNPTSTRSDFLGKFADTGPSPTDFQGSIPQALTRMNGTLVARATNLRESATLGAVIDAPFLDRAGKIETLFLACLSRPPRAEEAARFEAYAARADQDPKQALADVFWALLNSAEFALNH